MKIGHLDEASLLASEPQVYGGPVVGSEERYRLQWVVNDERATLGYEAFEPGQTANWAFWHNEAQLVLRGEAEVTYTLAPNHRKQVTKTLRVGDFYLIPVGARLRFRVTSDEPFVHACVIMPRVWHTKEELTDQYE